MYSSKDAIRMAALAGVELEEQTTDEHVIIAKFAWPMITATRNKFYNWDINRVASFVKIDQKIIKEDSFDLNE